MDSADASGLWLGVAELIHTLAGVDAAVLTEGAEVRRLLAATSTDLAAVAIALVNGVGAHTITCADGYVVVLAAAPRPHRAGPEVADVVAAIVELGARLDRSARYETELKEFLGRIQHGFRTPLTALLGMGELAETCWDEWDDAERREVVSGSKIAAEHLYRLTDTLTDEIMIEAWPWVPDFRPTSIAEIIAEAVDDVQHHRGDLLRMATQVDAMAPVTVDSGRLIQAVAALLDNAVCFSTPNTPVQIKAWHDAATDRVVIEISNEGEAIAAERMGRIFEPYVRGTPPPGRSYNGLGMGLPVARRIVRAHGGEVTVASQAGFTTARINLRADPPATGGVQ